MKHEWKGVGEMMWGGMRIHFPRRIPKWLKRTIYRGAWGKPHGNVEVTIRPLPRKPVKP